MTPEKQYFLVIGEELFIPELNNDDRILFGKILLYSRLKGYCWACNQTFADEVGVSVATIKRSLRKLKKLGFIKSYKIPHTNEHAKTNKYASWERRITICFGCNTSIPDKEQAVNNLLITRSGRGQIEPLLAEVGVKNVGGRGQKRPTNSNMNNNIYKNTSYQNNQQYNRKDTKIFKASKEDIELVKKMRPK